MRALDVGTLRLPDGGMPAWQPEQDLPLLLPWFIRPSEQTAIVQLHRRLTVGDQAPTVELTWSGGVLTADRRYLTYLRRRGPASVYVVVHVVDAGVDILDVQRQPQLRLFDAWAIRCSVPVKNDNLAPLAHLNHVASEVAEQHYDAWVEDLELDPDGWRLVRNVQRAFINPVRTLEAANALLEVQLEPDNPPNRYREQIIARMLPPRLAEQPAEGLILALGLATRRLDEARVLLKGSFEAQWSRFRDGLLVRAGEPAGWVALLRGWLLKAQSAEVYEALSPAVPTRAQLAEDWADPVREALNWLPTTVSSQLLPDNTVLTRVARALAAGRMEHAERLLEEARRDLLGQSASTRGEYCVALGQLRVAQGKTQEAAELFRNAGALVEGEPFAAKRGQQLGRAASKLESQGQYRRARQLFETALALAPDASDVLSEYAWLLFNVFHEQARALTLAQRSTEVAPEGSVERLQCELFHCFLRADSDGFSQVRRRLLELEELLPENPWVLSLIALRFASSLDDSSAKAKHAAAVALAPGSASIKLNQVGHLLALGQANLAELNQIEDALEEPDGQLEALFYRLAHRPLPALEQEVLALLRDGVRSFHFDLGRNVQHAIQDGYPDPERLQLIADVITHRRPLRDLTGRDDEPELPPFDEPEPAEGTGE